MEKHKYIYKTKLWEETRKAVIARDKGICFFCGKLISKRATVHHKEELNEDNYTDFDVAFNMDNLVVCHAECHNEHHERFGYKHSIVKDDLTIDYSRRKV
jgi:5-methylcytosine-specific restriction endonuclease McrA